jgi:glycosyltransferase involved in cell wall biosynthesis
LRVGLLFSNPYAQTGGVHTFEQDLFRCFLEVAARTRHDYHVICEPGLSHSGLPDLPPNITLAPMRPRYRPWTARWSVDRAMHRLRLSKDSREAQVVSAKGIEFLFSFGHYEHGCFDTSFMTTVLDLQHRLQPWFPEVSRDREWQRREDYFSRYLQRAAFVVTGTRQGRDEIERFYQVPRERIRILPLAVPRFSVQADARDPLVDLQRIGVVGRYLLYPAQFWSHKNHVNLLHALHHLRNELGEDVSLVLVGSDRGNESFVREVAQSLGLEDSVRFLGFVSQEDLITLYRGAFALAFVTYFGPDNLPPLEAFALGCPVVMSDVPGAREQLGEAALFVEPSNPRSIAGAVKRLCDFPRERDELIERGRARVGGWTSSDYASGLLALVDEFEAIRRCWQ